MKNILSNKELKEIRKNEFIDSGHWANVYKIDTGVIKVFNQKRIPISMQDNIKFLSQFENNSFIFPDELLYDRFLRLRAYTMEEIKSESLRTLVNFGRFDISLEELLLKFEIIKNDVFNISKNRIRIIDLNPDNMLFDGDFKFVDLDLYKHDKTSTIKELYKYNLIDVTTSLLGIITGYNRQVNAFMSVRLEDYVGKEDYFEKYIDSVNDVLKSEEKITRVKQLIDYGK